MSRSFNCDWRNAIKDRTKAVKIARFLALSKMSRLSGRAEELFGGARRVEEGKCRLLKLSGRVLAMLRRADEVFRCSGEVEPKKIFFQYQQRQSLLALKSESQEILARLEERRKKIVGSLGRLVRKIEQERYFIEYCREREARAHSVRRQIRDHLGLLEVCDVKTRASMGCRHDHN